MSRWGDGLLNTALVALGLVVIVLLYGLASRTFSPRTTPAREAESGATLTDPIQVEVRNAAGVTDLAQRTTEYLRRRGFDVIEMGNAERRGTSAVRILNGTPGYARRVSQTLGIAEGRIEEGEARDYDPDVVVFIGLDYRSLTPFEMTED